MYYFSVFLLFGIHKELNTRINPLFPGIFIFDCFMWKKIEPLVWVDIHLHSHIILEAIFFIVWPGAV